MAGEAEDLEVIDLPDDDAASDQGADKGQEAEATPDPVEVLAAKAGWKPKDQWKGDQSKWTPAEDFLLHSATQNKSLRDQVKRTATVAERAIEQNRKKAIEDAQRQIAQAAEDGDKEAALKGAKALEQASAIGTTPRDDFRSRNAWFEDDEEATDLAIAAAQRVADKGGSVKEQFEAAEARVRKLRPDLFEDDAAPEDRPSRSAPAVQGGTRTSGAPRKKGWADMPAEARAVNEKAFVKKGLMTREEIADAYWQENA